MEKKEVKRPKADILCTGLDPGIMARFEITRPSVSQLEMNPDAKSALFKGRSLTAREFYEHDVSRIKESMQIGRIEPRLQTVDRKHKHLDADVDLRTGRADVSELLPKHIRIKDERIPDIPERTLSAAMKKLKAKR